jgi:hypothetical protein
MFEALKGKQETGNRQFAIRSAAKIPQCCEATKREGNEQ